MKLFILYTVFTALLFCLNICEGTTVNNEQEEFGIVQGAILQFQKDTNEFPTSWDDLWKNPVSRPSVESLEHRKNFGIRTDMMESFRFIAPGTTILLPGDGARVVGMMTRPMRPPPERKLRLLVLQLKDGTRGSKQVPEEVLQKMFSRAGFDLADYTGANGNWAPETRLRPLSEIPPIPKKALSDPSIDYSTIPSLPEKTRLGMSNDLTNATAKKSALFPWWIIASFFVMIVIALVAWLKSRKIKSAS